MSVAMTEGKSDHLDQARRRQTLVIGWTLVALAVFVAAVFGVQSSGDATFRLAIRTDAFALPNLVVPAAPFAYFISVLLAFLGARQFVRGAAKRSSLFFGIGMLLAVAAFLVWAT